MSYGAAILVLVVLVLAGLASPVLAAPADCAADDECWGLDCPLCLCCSHLPRPIPGDMILGLADDPSAGVDAEAGLALVAPAPRDILHVPKLLSLG